MAKTNRSKTRKPKQDEPVVNGRLVKKRFDFNSYDVVFPWR